MADWLGAANPSTGFGLPLSVCYQQRQPLFNTTDYVILPPATVWI
ncbi:MAG: hypothetical protein R2773_05805 [Flavobacteriaceae bacterium]